jgi:hypothetical protein
VGRIHAKYISSFVSWFVSNNYCFVARLALVRVIAGASLLPPASAPYFPSVAPDTSEIDGTPIPKEEWSQLFHSLKERLGPLDGYWEIFDSTEKGEPIQASLAEDISEIYHDLKSSYQIGLM